MKEIDFLFFVEHEARELMAIKYLAKALESKGYSSAIQSIFGIGSSTYQIKPRVVLIPYIAKKHDLFLRFISSYYGRNTHVISFNHEQILHKANKEFKRPTTDFIKNQITHLSWGGDFTSYLKESGVNIDKIVELPKLNYACYHHSEGIELYDDERIFYNEVKASKSSVFFPTNFNWAFISDETIKEKVKRGYPEKIAAIYHKFSLHLFDKTIKEILSFAKRNLDTLIIIRPHPGISVYQYKDRIAQLGLTISDNVRISDMLNIYILSDLTDVIISNWSTTIFDGYKNGFNCYQLLMDSIPNELGIYPFEGLPQLEKLPNTMNTLIKKEVESDSSLNVIDQYSYFLMNLANNQKKYQISFHRLFSGKIYCVLFEIRNRLLKRRVRKDKTLKLSDFFNTFYYG